MKTFFRRSLPSEIKYNGKIYERSSEGRTSESVKVEVLSSRLEGKTDLHGNYYKPTIHYFNPA